jgi:Domain of unknown function (DUF3846)
MMPRFLFVPAAWDTPPQTRDIDPGDLAALQQTVGGHVEIIHIHIPELVCIAVWDDAIAYHAPHNPRASVITGRLLRGDVALYGPPARGQRFSDVPDTVMTRIIAIGTEIARRRGGAAAGEPS